MKGPRLHLLAALSNRCSSPREEDRRWFQGGYKFEDGSKISYWKEVVTEHVQVIAGDGDSDTSTISSVSTNDTCDDNVGPGRMLDKAYQYFGRKIELFFFRASRRLTSRQPHPYAILQYLQQGEDWSKWDSNYNSTMTESLETVIIYKGHDALEGLNRLVVQTKYVLIFIKCESQRFQASTHLQVKISLSISSSSCRSHSRLGMDDLCRVLCTNH